MIDGATVETECREAGGGSSSPQPVRAPTPKPCSWRSVPVGEAFGGGVVIQPDPSAGFEYFVHGDGAIGRRFPDGREEKGFERRCTSGLGGFVWVESQITIDEVIADAVGRARQTAPLPTLDISPEPSVGGVVNLGMWLAVEARSPQPARVEAGSLWAVSTLTPQSTTWSFGNGDVVTCAGIGTPIVDLDTSDQGPCGYTYRSPSPAGSPFQLTATVTWSVDYTSSAGSGSAGTIDRSVSIPYVVDEIVSIGTESRSSG